MLSQTITLFRYQLLGIINARNLFLLILLFLVAFLASQFVAQLAILKSEPIAIALMADILRYCLVLFMIISLSYQVSQDYELGQFERLLSMPLTRLQYVLAQFLVMLAITFITTLPVLAIMLLLTDPSLAFYWSAATFLELILVGQFTLLAIISLEKLPLAVIFSLALYLLAKSVSLIDLILSRSALFYDEERSFQLIHFLFSGIQYVLPDAFFFAQNNVFFESLNLTALISQQFLSVLLYCAFLLAIILVDFYRKEFH